MSQPIAQLVPDSPFANFSVRAACATDAHALASLLQQLGDDEPRPDPVILAMRLNEPNQGRVVLVAEREGKLLGTCTVHLIEHLAHNFARSAILEDVVVDANMRGLGVGQALVHKAAERARNWGCYKMALSSRDNRADAQRFYQTLGYQLHGVSLVLEPV
nr:MULTISPECIES: GNAT family N-acetyltransferase [Pseudomonas]